MKHSSKNEHAIIMVTPPGSTGYPYHLAESLACPAIPKPLKGNGVLIVVDENVRWYLNDIISHGHLYECEYHILTICSERKDLKTATMIWEEMVACNCNAAVAVGGGTVCDLTAFTASCFKRGTQVYMFPTTPLAAMDASISGKTGIDFSGIKNSVGTIHYPNTVVATLDSFDTLDKAELLSGFSEALKVAVTSSNEYFRLIERWYESGELTGPGLFPIIKQSCHLKANIVAAPPNERLISLYGHVIGHGIESFSPPRRRHGDCVAIGLHQEGYLALRLGLWTEQDWLRQKKLLQSLHLPTSIPESISTSDLMERIVQSKFFDKGMLNLILPSSIGQVARTGDSFMTRIHMEEVARYMDELR